MGGMGEIGRPTSVLLVEDEVLISEWMAEALEELGFEVHTAVNAGEALRHLNSGCAVDVLFTDINLPGDMDGSMLARRARELRPDLPVVYASGRFSGLDQLHPVPGSTFIPKPYTPVEVCCALQRLVHAGTPVYA